MTNKQKDLYINNLENQILHYMYSDKTCKAFNVPKPNTHVWVDLEFNRSERTVDPKATMRQIFLERHENDEETKIIKKARKHSKFDY